MFDVLIRGGEIIDGSGGPRSRVDVAIAGDRIAQIGDLSGASASRTLDVAGLIVCPGFVDVHNHAEGWLWREAQRGSQDDATSSKTLQGFTTEVLALDGISYAPVSEHTWREWFFYLRALDGLRMDEYGGWRSLAEFMQRLDGRTAQNAATHVPYANVRSLLCGFGRGPVDDFQMRSIRRILREQMEEAGAVGISTGLDYLCQCFSTTDELVEAASVLRETGGLYVTHIRYKKGLAAGLAEAFEIGRRAGVPVHISHLKAPSPSEIGRVLETIDQASRDVDLSFDVYPYQPGSTMLNYLLPYEAWQDGPLAALGKLNDPAFRERLRAGLRAYKNDLDEMHIAWLPGKENAGCQGMLMSEYVAASGLPAEEAIVNLLIEERLGVLMVYHEGDDEWVRPFLSHDLYVMGSDGIYQSGGQIHPRQYGSAGRLLGPCVRDWKLFTLEVAVHKMTGKPAARFGLPNRGLLRPGAFADLVVFDPATITDRATFEEPHQHTVGVRWVVVNGREVVSDGRVVPRNGTDRSGKWIQASHQVIT